MSRVESRCIGWVNIWGARSKCNKSGQEDVSQLPNLSNFHPPSLCVHDIPVHVEDNIIDLPQDLDFVPLLVNWYDFHSSCDHKSYFGETYFGIFWQHILVKQDEMATQEEKSILKSFLQKMRTILSFGCIHNTTTKGDRLITTWGWQEATQSPWIDKQWRESIFLVSGVQS